MGLARRIHVYAPGCLALGHMTPRLHSTLDDASREEWRVREVEGGRGFGDETRRRRRERNVCSGIPSLGSYYA